MSLPPPTPAFGSFSVAPAGRSQLRSSLFFFFFSPPHPLKFGDGTIAERRQFLPLPVCLPRSWRGSPGSEMLPQPLPSRRPPAAQALPGGSAGHCRLPRGAAPASASDGLLPRPGGSPSFAPHKPRLPRGRGSGREGLGREGRTVPHQPSGVRRRRGAAGRRCRGCGGCGCATSPSRSSPFPLILPPPQPGLRFLLPDPQILAG